MEHYSYKTFLLELNLITIKYQINDNPNSKENIKAYQKAIKELNKRYLECCKLRDKYGNCCGEYRCKRVRKCFVNKFKKEL